MSPETPPASAIVPRPMPKVSVIVPVYNPGSDIDECIASLLGQSLPDSDYEAIFVDDGSTDGTPARLDALAAEHAHVHVAHIPNSGWPGKPRNVGMDIAAGEFVYFVDNDDWLEPDALERMLAMAVADDADIVIGKVVGQGKFVPRTLFRENLHGVTLGDSAPLLGLLTPHKLFRRSLLDEQGIRFPEGRRRLEDHVFVMHAYFHARRVSVLADHPCYHWVLRDAETNASYAPFDAKAYFANVREVLDVVEAHTEPGPLRDRLMRHWYRGKMLGRLGGAAFAKRDPAYNRELYDEILALADERYGPGAADKLPFNLRLRSHLLVREGGFEALGILAAREGELRARPRVRDLRGDGTWLALTVEAELAGAEHGPLTFRRSGERLLWIPPVELGELPEELLDVTAEIDKAKVQVLLRGIPDRVEYAVPGETTVRLEPVPGAPDGVLHAVLSTHAHIAPTIAAAGAPLPAGEWELDALVTIAGFSHLRVIRRKGANVVLVARPPGRVAVRDDWRPPPPSADGPARRLARRVPGVLPVVRRLRALRSARAPRGSA
jgi:glycosyltransferase involved in cell wall biosynthesis